MSEFRGRHVEGEIALRAVRWYRRHGIRPRDLERMMAESGVAIDHSTLLRWTHH